ncbi:MAG: Ig-like domain-containing protein, partial [Thiobacillus sp.]
MRQPDSISIPFDGKFSDISKHVTEKFSKVAGTKKKGNKTSENGQLPGDDTEQFDDVLDAEAQSQAAEDRIILAQTETVATDAASATSSTGAPGAAGGGTSETGASVATAGAGMGSTFNTALLALGGVGLLAAAAGGGGGGGSGGGGGGGGGVSSTPTPPPAPDTTPPGAPVINAVATDNIINIAEQTSAISGTAEANATVALSLGNVTRTITANGSGVWSYSLVAADITNMGQGAETLSATATDAAGNTSSAGTRTITVDTVAPTATAAITGANDNVAPTTGNIASGGTTDDNTPTLSGTISGSLGSGEVVAVYDGAVRMGSASVSGATWSFATISLSNSTHNFSVRVEDAAGNQGTASVAYSLTVSATAPTATATITGTVDDVAPVTGNVASGGVSNDTTPTLSGAVVGTLVAGDVIAIYDGATRLGTASITGASWNFTTAILGDGGHSFTALVENSVGNQGAVSSPYTVTVDTVAPAVIITTNDGAMKIGDVATLTFALSESSTTFAASDVVVTGGTLSGFAGSGALYTASFTPSANSTSAATVDVASGTFTDAAGNNNTAATQLSMAVDTVAPTVTITTNDSALKIGDVATLTFTLSEASTTFAAGDVVVTGGILSGFAGSGTLYTASFTPTANSTTAATVNVAAGTFTDAAGNNNTAATQLNMTVDTFAPAAPTVNTVAGNDIINAAEQGAAITGTNEAGASVALSLGGNTRAATVTGTTWSYT